MGTEVGEGAVVGAGAAVAGGVVIAAGLVGVDRWPLQPAINQAKRTHAVTRQFDPHDGFERIDLLMVEISASLAYSFVVLCPSHVWPPENAGKAEFCRSA